jgi:Icc-related predicted phosphoesterase
MKILAISDFHGETKLMNSLVENIKDKSPDLIVFTGDVVKGQARGDEWLSAQEEGREPVKDKKEILDEKKKDFKLYDEFYDKLDTLDIPVMCIPGNMDAPEDVFFSYLLGKRHCN